MSRWKDFDDYLLREHYTEGETFTNEWMVDKLGLPSWEVSAIIQSYKLAMSNRNRKNRPSFAIHRVPGSRTRNAEWRLSTNNVQEASATVASDLERRLEIHKPEQTHRADLSLDPETRKLVKKQRRVTRLVLPAFERALIKGK